MYNKKNGVYYTPPLLAEFLAERLITSEGQTILDPSYGEGALLLAAERIKNRKFGTSQIHLFGCDTKPLNGLLNHLPQANLKEIDFFDYSIENKFQIVLMNPPYVRHHIQDLDKIKRYRSSYSELNLLNKNADLWAYFLMKAVAHLCNDGSIGAILPWAFLQADYAKPLRLWLYEKFKEIEVIAFSNKYFEFADERIVVLWLKNYRQKNTLIRIASSTNIEARVTFSEITLTSWLEGRVNYSGNNIEEILARCQREYSFSKFSEYADVKIGVVTGAVDYFIMSKQKAKELGFKSSNLMAILTEGDEFTEYIKSGKKKLGVLISLKSKDQIQYKSFLKTGVEKEIHLRAHSKLRKPWYSIKIGDIPDAFFHYRIAKIPYLLPNFYNIQSTNAIHRIYYNNLTDIEKKWIAVSLLSEISQLSIEVNAKTYGRGVLKIEPSSLKKTLVVCKNEPVIDDVYNQVLALLSINKKEVAVQVASEFIYKQLSIPNDLKKTIKIALSKIQELRLTKK